MSFSPQNKNNIINRMVSRNASHRLTVIPTAPADHYDLSPNQFRDALSLSYGHEI